ncbi:nucleic acid-binding protein [Streptomyces sp. NPDC014892]|uniref:nucleic acid-binding protein n=1 Tax=Streptomyces sp. NPDC014892 TaxID=3364930 RepID=UPI0036FF9062
MRADLAALFTALPYSVEPMEAWARPEGYWSTCPVHPDSPGWTEQEQQQVAELRERERELAATIVTHGFWKMVDRPERPDARSGLRHSAVATAAGPDAGEQAA